MITEITINEDGSQEVVVRSATAQEQAQQAADEAAATAAQAAAEQAETDRVAGIVAAQTELHDLGLSDTAIAAISGHPYPYLGTD